MGWDGRNYPYVNDLPDVETIYDLHHHAGGNGSMVDYSLWTWEENTRAVQRNCVSVREYLQPVHGIHVIDIWRLGAGVREAWRNGEARHRTARTRHRDDTETTPVPTLTPTPTSPSPSEPRLQRPSLACPTITCRDVCLTGCKTEENFQRLGVPRS